MVTIRDARRSGIPDPTWYARVRREQWPSLGAGAWLLPGCAQTEFARRHAALEVLGPEAALSHGTALAVLGLREQQPHDDWTHVVVPYGVTVQPPHGVRRHRSRDLTDADRTMVENLPVTTAARTIVDVAGGLPVWRLEALLLAGRQRRLLTLDDAHQQIQRRRGLRGRAAARRAIEVLCSSDADSILEHRCREVLRAAGIDVGAGPRPVVCDGHHLVVDLVVAGASVAIECDGRAYHTSDEAFERDRRRWQLLKEAGWRIVWVTWRRLHETPHDVVAEVRREVRRQR